MSTARQKVGWRQCGYDPWRNGRTCVAWADDDITWSVDIHIPSYYFSSWQGFHKPPCRCYAQTTGPDVFILHDRSSKKHAVSIPPSLARTQVFQINTERTRENNRGPRTLNSPCSKSATTSPKNYKPSPVSLLGRHLGLNKPSTSMQPVR